MQASSLPDSQRAEPRTETRLYISYYDALLNDVQPIASSMEAIYTSEMIPEIHPNTKSNSLLKCNVCTHVPMCFLHCLE